MAQEAMNERHDAGLPPYMRFGTSEYFAHIKENPSPSFRLGALHESIRALAANWLAELPQENCSCPECMAHKEHARELMALIGGAEVSN